MQLEIDIEESLVTLAEYSDADESIGPQHKITVFGPSTRQFNAVKALGETLVVQPLHDVLDVGREQGSILVTEFPGMACVDMAAEFMRVELHRYGVAEPKHNSLRHAAPHQPRIRRLCVEQCSVV